jgi:hypothetical protein
VNRQASIRRCPRAADTSSCSFWGKEVCRLVGCPRHGMGAQDERLFDDDDKDKD